MKTLTTLLILILSAQVLLGIEVEEYIFGTEDYSERGRTIVRTSDRAYAILCEKYPRFSVVKFTADYDVVWTWSFDSPEMLHIYGEGMAPADNGGVVVVGYMFEEGDTWGDAFVLEIDSEGNLSWLKIYDRQEYRELAFSIIRIDDGYIIRSNLGLVKINLIGDIQWIEGSPNAWSLGTLMKVNDGFMQVGSLSSGYGNPMLVKYTDDGEVIWQQVYYGFVVGGHAGTICKAVDYGYVIAVTTYNEEWIPPTDGFILKTDEYGNEEWREIYGSVGHDWIGNIVRSWDGGYFFTV